ncbi:helix-turn-helix domain-containing protein [Salmonirosea aquatica]|uniref:Helix-turn-helix domain-containing protein n=1 Tax=Salmonirosea aquatica TaxID=2654236 RepID=A0A7C9BCY0_9BACT|nr:helix-turn-helix domain-containing protein [Cytophagaceae bacterium SJW1-29]
MKLSIKNMVCDRCIKVVREELEALGLTVEQIELGSVQLAGTLSAGQAQQVKARLEANGFELLEDARLVLVEYMKKLIIDEVQHLKARKPAQMNFSDYLSEKCGYEYSHLSHLFSATTGQTVEQYIIAQKIEKVKEWLSYGELSMTEIAWRLGYSSAAHLGNQFKKVTGLTPGQYKKDAGLVRKTLDQV